MIDLIELKNLMNMLVTEKKCNGGLGGKKIRTTNNIWENVEGQIVG